VCLVWFEPHAHVAARCGETNARLRGLLWLQLPRGMRMRIGDESVELHEGSCLVFDESFESELWNRGRHPGVLLSFELVHPDLRNSSRSEFELLYQDSYEKKVMKFCKQRNIRRLVMHDDDDFDMYPDAATESMVRYYMEENAVRSVEIADGHLRFNR
jgi:aspartate beta-hydroxylase